MKSAIVLLDAAAPSFCFYEPGRGSEPQKMTAAVLSETARLAERQDLVLHLLCGPDGLSRDQRSALEKTRVPHICYFPAGSDNPITGDQAQSSIPVVESSAPGAVDRLAPGAHFTAVLRAAQEHMDDLPGIWESLAQRVYRVVLVLSGLEQYDLGALQRYENALAKISEKLEKIYATDKKEIELSAISDRMALGEPKHCLAGIDHLTVAPDGRLHICPGFAVAGRPAVGDLASGADIPNAQLLELARAPLCRICDAYQCRRCVHLNLTVTKEINTPPWQGCRTAHVEREASRLLLNRLRAGGMLRALPEIPPLRYTDPLDAFLNPQKQLEKFKYKPPKTSQPKKGKPAGLTPPKGHGRDSAESCCALPKETERLVGQVTAEERDEIRTVHMRRIALGDLFMGLAGSDLEAIAKDPLYERLIVDAGEVSIRFQRWWEKTAARYGWEREPKRRWRIEFESRNVFLS